LKTPYFLLYNFVKRKIYIVFKEKPKSNLNILFKPVCYLTSGDNNISWSNEENGYFVYNNVDLDSSETCFCLSNWDSTISAPVFQLIPSIMVDQIIVDDPNIKIEQEIGYFKLAWSGGNTITDR
jgi:hypothetical protein